MQSTISRLLSTLIMVLLLCGLAVVILLVLQQNLAPTPATQRAQGADPRVTTGTAVVLPGTQSSSNSITSASSISASLSAPVTTMASGAPAIEPAVGQREPRITPTATPSAAILRPTATPTPLIALLTPMKPVARPPRGWSVYSNGNQVTGLTVLNNTIWAATGGGVVSWNRANNAGVKFTVLDGLAANRTTAVVNCPLPGFGLLFGTEEGLELFDPQLGTWTILNSANSEMHYDDIVTLDCSVDHGFLVVGYRQHGLDIFDLETGEWRLVDRRNGLQRDLVDAVTVVGDLDALWVSSGFGVSVLTETGAFFYDRNNSPLETNQINVMRSDAKGTVWLGTRDKVYAVNGENWTIYSPAYVLASRFPTGEITDLAIGRDGALWIGSDAGELCKFDVAAVTCDPFFAPEELGTQGGITALALDNLGRLYVATANDGVRFYDEVGWRSFILPSQLNGNQIRALTQDVAGYLWVMSEAGLQQLDPQDTTRTLLFTDLNTDYPIATVATLFADPEQGIWVGGQDAGYFTGATWTTFGLIDGLIDRRVRAVVVDEQQRTWIGTENGLSIWNGDSFFNLTGADGLPGETVTALLADGEAVWIGTNNGLLRFAENRLQIFTTATTQLPSNQITALAIDEDHALWIGTTHGLVRFLGKTMSPMSEFENQAVVALAVLAGNAIWVTTEQMGLQYFNGLRWTTPPGDVTLPTAMSSTLFVDRQGTLWIGGVGGLLRYVP